MASAVLTALGMPIFPSSTTNATQLAPTGGIAPISSVVPIYTYAQWQLFGGSSLTQLVSNDALVGMWWDDQISNNPTVKTLWTDVLKTYYQYDGFVLVMDAKVGNSPSATDELWACIQRDTAVPKEMTCAITKGTSATMATTAAQTTALMVTPDFCYDFSGMTTSKPTAKTTNASLWSDRPCNGVYDFRDGTLGCWGQTYKTQDVSNNFW